MKLVDILARELKAWPEKSVAAVQQNSTDDRVSFVDCIDVEFSMGQWDYSEPCMRIHEQKESHEFERADDWKTAIVTRAEWKAAVDALNAYRVEYSPVMHAQRVGRVTRVTENPALVDSREQFEQAYCEDNGGVDLEGKVLPRALATLVEMRMGDSYRLPGTARAWNWWKRARAGVVVVLPMALEDDLTLIAAIEAAGVKVAT